MPGQSRPRGEPPYDRSRRPPVGSNGPAGGRREDADSNGAAFTTLRVAKYGPPIVQCNDRRKQYPSYQQANSSIQERYQGRFSGSGPSHSGPSSHTHRVPPMHNGKRSPVHVPTGPSRPWRPQSHFDHRSHSPPSVATSSNLTALPRPPSLPARPVTLPSHLLHPAQTQQPRQSSQPERPANPPSTSQPPPPGERPASPRPTTHPKPPAPALGPSSASKKKKNKKKKLEAEEAEVFFNSAFVPLASALEQIPPAPSATTKPRSSPPRQSSQPPLHGPPPKLVFKPNKSKTSRKDDREKESTNKASSSHSTQSQPFELSNARPDALPLLDKKPSVKQPRQAPHHSTPMPPAEPVDRKPTLAELEPATSIAPPSLHEAERESGVWAFKKDETPAECWSRNSAEKSIARTSFKHKKKAELRAMGKTVTQTMWRDDGFALTWQKMQPHPSKRLSRSPSVEPMRPPPSPSASVAHAASSIPVSSSQPANRAPPDYPSYTPISPVVPSLPRSTQPPPATPREVELAPAESQEKTTTFDSPALSKPSGLTPRGPTSEKLVRLEREIQQDLSTIDRWTTMQSQFPRQAETLGRQIDRVQAAIFAKFALVEEEKARLGGRVGG